MTRIAASDRRSALVQAALRVVAERGVAAATTRAIVAEAGMSLASFHYVFTSRDELMSELVSFVVAQQERALAPVLVPTGGRIAVREAVRAGLLSYFEVVRADPDREKAMFELTHYAMRSAELAPLARLQYDSYYALAENALAVASDLTGAAWDRPLHEIATLLVVLTDGLTLSWLVNRDDAAAEAIIDFASDAVARLATSHSDARTA